MTFDSKATGKRIRSLRKERDIPLYKAAGDLNVNEQHLGRVERGERNPSLDFLLSISEYYSVSTDYLLKGLNGNQNLKAEIGYVVEKLRSIERQL